MQRERFALVHGTKSSPDANWFPWLGRELKGRGFEVIVPKFPTPTGQSLDAWREVFRREFGVLAENTTLIGHSIGAVFLLRLLERSDFQVKRSIFVSGLLGRISIGEYDELNSSFLADPINWERVIQNSKERICIMGDNDPYVPFKQGAEFSKRLGVAPVVVKDGGHLNSESGFLEFPLLLTLV